MTDFNNEICQKFSKTFAEVFRFSFYASRRYKVYEIPKRTGGLRKIAQPSAELKEYQRYIISNIFSHFPIHASVYSYQRDKNIKQMALEHLKSNFLLRIDFIDFFSSIQSEHIREFLRSKSKTVLPVTLKEHDITLINLLVCKGGRLTIGAPSSPIISNIILYDLDEFLTLYCSQRDITYTRYADDLYFSTSKPDILKYILPSLSEYLKTFFIRLRINNKKTINTSRKTSQQVTGLRLTTDRKLSIGRDKKRYIKSLIFKYSKQKLDFKQLNYLKGYLSYIYSIEPEYIQNLKTKYSSDLIQELLPLKRP
ncbi:MAG: retron St85 family RNA-directed DNA polymerase [Sulfuricurvum sp.]|nr:retron St85 family RNA-directed DNA polymerase [Sulfuricurvum sp.]